MKPIIFKVLSVLCMIFSFLVLWGEITIPFETHLSVFILMTKSLQGPVITQILCLIPLSYILTCAYLALFIFKFKGFGLYSSNQTDAASLCWNAYIMSTMSPAICHNFILFLKLKESEFYKTYGILNLIPFLGETVAKYFPFILVLLCILNYFEFFTKTMTSLGYPQLAFFSDVNDEDVIRGKAILDVSKVYLERYEYVPSPSSYEPPMYTLAQ